MTSNKIISIAFFFIAVLLINTFVGKKATFYFLGLVLLGQLIVNTENIKSIGSYATSLTK